MTDPSKILTVSYGTFSCTLEGFDDPFSAMRGIAEYFRDLAADDRYFGAEPATPDAELLHQIAEREASNRVEAQLGDNSVVLRQLDGSPEKQAPAPHTEQAPAPQAAPIAPAIAASDPPETAADPVDLSPINETPKIKTESVAEKLARIRAVVSDEQKQEETRALQEDELLKEPFTSAPISSVFSPDQEIEEAELSQQEEQQFTTPESPDDNGYGVQEDATEEKISEAHSTEETAFDSAGDTAQEYEPEAVEDDGGSEWQAQGDSAEHDEDIAQEDEVKERYTPAQGYPVEQKFDAEPEDQPEEGESSGNGQDAFFASTATGPNDQAYDDVAENDAGYEEEGIDDDQLSNFDDGDNDDAFTDPDAPAIARVVKMRRSDFEAAMETGEFEEVSDDDYEYDDEVEEEVEKVSTLSAEDEAELMANLSELQRRADAEKRAEKEGRALMENQDIESDVKSVSRILDVTNTELQETEGTRRRSAIAHLKAAVAATRADKNISQQRDDDDANILSRYRADLANVVRPNRSPKTEHHSERPSSPLVLVSEQRISESVTQSSEEGPIIHPHRVTSGNLALEDDEMILEQGATDDNIFRPEHSFAEFVAGMGAQELPDLLEAAAAYFSFVEGNTYFSRPQIMQAVADLDEDQEYTREESLRSFGLLLRRGKIKKIRRGQFSIADTTRFNPQIRAVGE